MKHKEKGSTLVRTSYSSRPHRVQFLEKNKVKMKNEKLRKEKIIRRKEKKMKGNKIRKNKLKLRND